MAEAESQAVLPILEEHLRLDKRVVSTGKVRVRTLTEMVEETARARLFEEAVEVRRVRKDEFVETVPAVRTEGDVTIIPVLEEVLVVETRLMLTEEIHVHRRVTSDEVSVPVTLRKQRAVIEPQLEPHPPEVTDHPLTSEETTMAYETDTTLSTGASTTATTQRTLTALFDSQDSANAAIERLADAGISRDHIRLMPGAEASSDATRDTAGGRATGGFWEGLKDLFLPDEDRHAYAEGLSRGGYLVTVQTTAADYDRISDILDQEGTLDIDEQESQWRESGWTGYTGSDYTGTAGSGRVGLGGAGLGGAGLGGAGTAGAASVGVGAAGLGASGLGASGLESTGYETGSAATTTAATGGTSPAALTGGSTLRTDTARTAADDEVIPVAEETLRVGKREVNQGRVRVRSYVVETPVREDVSLREERVNVERRPVDRAVGANEDLFRERTIELDQRAEEAVVSKDVRVTEEVLLNKEVNQRTETVSDTVRRTEVEFEDGRTAGVSTGGSQAARFVAGDAAQIQPHMEVIAADGQSIGRVDHLDGDRIKLTRNDSPDHEHHFVPLSWIDHIDRHVHLNKSLAEIKAGR